MNISNKKKFKINNFLKLQKKYSLRKKQNIIIVEGLREIKKALEGKYLPKKLLLCKEICQESIISKNFPIVIQINKNSFEKISYRKKSGGVIGIFYRFYQNKFTLQNLNISKNPLLLILENIEKPGNLGAIIRSSEAVGVEGVIICQFKTDIFHPNVIRSSLGTIFTQKIIISNISELIPWLKEKKIQIISSVLKKNATNLYNINFRYGTAIVIGSESYGLSNNIIKKSNIILQIPMYGNIDSLNVSNATAIILFEALRQRSKF